jgi:hypothetical protein
MTFKKNRNQSFRAVCGAMKKPPSAEPQGDDFQID